MGALRTKSCASPPARASLPLSLKKWDYPALWGCCGVFPLLRRKSGLCYTADANSPFEAYIYVR
jgi:hypothetical protein